MSQPIIRVSDLICQSASLARGWQREPGCLARCCGMFGVSELSRKKGEGPAFSISLCFSSVRLNCIWRDGAPLCAQGMSRWALFSAPMSEEPNKCCPYLVLYFHRDLLSKGISSWQSPTAAGAAVAVFCTMTLGGLLCTSSRITVGLWSCLLFLWPNAGITLLRLFAHSGTRHRNVREQPFL